MKTDDNSIMAAFNGYHSKHTHEKRAVAVAAALEIIRADASGGNTEVGGELKNLAKYADHIQKALND